MVDNQDTAGQYAQPEGPPEEVTQTVHELAEALAALGNYVAAASHILKNGKADGGKVRKALDGGLGQH